MERIETNAFLEGKSQIPILDVRSPKEYEAGHIPGAISMPLFSNEERAEVGTLYKQKGRQAAIKRGLDIVGPKMSAFIEQAEQLASEQLNLYCWRGGMRSDSMGWLMERYGFKTQILEGGYKAYRKSQRAFYEQPLPLRVITGHTGSKKTQLLHLIAEAGGQIIDLEGHANHQGSSFGNQKTTGQPTTEQFQNNLFEAFRQLDLDQPIWIEDENIVIGMVNLPDELFQQLQQSPHYFLEVPPSERVAFLVEDYGYLPVENLMEATRKISKRLGPQNTKKALEYLQAGDLAKATEILLWYYDKSYDKTIHKKEPLIRERFQITFEELPKLAVQLAKMK